MTVHTKLSKELNEIAAKFQSIIKRFSRAEQSSIDLAQSSLVIDDENPTSGLTEQQKELL